MCLFPLSEVHDDLILVIDMSCGRLFCIRFGHGGEMCGAVVSFLFVKARLTSIRFRLFVARFFLEMSKLSMCGHNAERLKNGVLYFLIAAS